MGEKRKMKNKLTINLLYFVGFIYNIFAAILYIAFIKTNYTIFAIGYFSFLIMGLFSLVWGALMTIENKLNKNYNAIKLRTLR